MKGPLQRQYHDSGPKCRRIRTYGRVPACVSVHAETARLSGHPIIVAPCPLDDCLGCGHGPGGTRGSLRRSWWDSNPRTTPIESAPMIVVRAAHVEDEADLVRFGPHCGFLMRRSPLAGRLRTCDDSAPLTVRVALPPGLSASGAQQ